MSLLGAAWRAARGRLGTVRFSAKAAVADLAANALVFRLLLALVLTFFAIYAPLEPDAARWHPLVAIALYVAVWSFAARLRPARLLPRQWAWFAGYLFDIVVITLTMYWLHGWETDLYVAYFMVILLSVKGSNLLHNLAVGVTAAAFYGGLLVHWHGAGSLDAPDFLMRLPFLFLVCAYTALIAARLGQTEDSLREASERLAGANVSLRGTVRERTRDLDLASREIQAVHELTVASFACRSLDDFWPLLGERLKALFGCERSSFFLLDQAGGLTSLYAEGVKGRIRLRPGQGLAGFVSRERLPVFTNDPYGDPRFAAGVDWLSGFSTRNLMACPIVREGEVTGVVELLNKAPGFSERDVERMARIAPEIQVIYDKLKGDIERQRMQSTLVESEKLAAIGRLMGGLSHEIKNPLTGVLGNAQLLLRGGKVSGEEREMVEDIERCAKYCNEILTNLLLYARRSSGEPAPHGLAGIAEETLRLTGRRFELAGVKVARLFPPGDLTVRCNRVELQQVILNLLVNALQAMASGGELTLRMRRAVLGDYLAGLPDRPVGSAGAELLRSRLDRSLAGANARAEDWAVLEVSDTGAGLEAEVMGRIFEPFFTTKAPGEGAGLGLSVSRMILERHGGALVARNNEGGRGATFALVLPLRR